MNVRDKVAVVTGASSWIGEAAARRLARDGARVVLAARRTDRIQALAAGTRRRSRGDHRYARARAGPGAHCGAGGAVELANEGIAVSVLYPFVTATEFHDTLRAGQRLGARPGLKPQPPELVADAIAHLIATGEEEAILVPDQLLRNQA